MKLFFSFLFLFSSVYFLRAQDTIDNFLEQRLENIAEEMQSETQDYSTLLEALNYFKQHPINLNQTSKEELEQLNLLDDIQIGNLLEHIDKNGKLISIYELQSVEGFDLQTIDKISPYIKVADATNETHLNFKEILQHGNHQIISRYERVLEPQVGFSTIDSAGICKSPNSRYIGSADKLYERYKFNFGTNVNAGITATKDAGELFFKQNQHFKYPCYDSLLKGKAKNGFDFYSAHLFLRNIRFVKALALGDYQIGFGQGLTAWSGISYRKTPDAMAIKKYAQGLRPYTSKNESNFLRGAAATIGNNSLRFTGFYSQRKIDANPTLQDSLNPDEVAAASSLQTTGLHATASELADKGSITQTIFGGNANFQKRKFSFGLTGLQTILSASLQPSSSNYNQFDFRGKQLTNFGADYSFLFHNLNFFGEAAVSTPDYKFSNSSQIGFAYLNGMIASLDPKLSFSVLHRSIQRNYQSFFANAFAETSAPPSNEQGIYMGVTVKPTNAITLNAFYDYFIFPWLKYQVNAPSHGNDFLLQAQYTPNKKFDTYWKVRIKNKFTNSGSVNEIDYIIPYTQRNYRWNTSYLVTPSLMLRSRAELIVLDNSSTGKEHGFVMYQDIIWKNIFHRVSLKLRYALFDTKSYNSRVYALEEDVPGAYSIPSYYYKGSRVFVMANIHLTRKIELWLRWGQTYYTNKNVISAGSLDEIDGNKKTDVKVELRMRF